MSDVTKKKNVRKSISTAIVVGLIVLAAIIGLSNAFYTIPEGYIAATYTFGKLDSIRTSTGVNVKVPFIQTVKRIDMREQSDSVEFNAYTKDTQTVEAMTIKINYRLDVSQMEKIIQEIGVDYIYDKVILLNALSITRNTIGQYAADELIGHRSEISLSIQEQLIEKLGEKGVTLSAFTIQDINFEDSFEAAVQRKVEAEQKALEAQNQTREKEELGKQKVIEAQAEADAIKAKAEAEAYAIEVINKQLANSPSYTDYLKVTRWDGRLPLVQGSDSAPILDMRGIDISSASSGQSAVE